MESATCNKDDGKFSLDKVTDSMIEAETTTSSKSNENQSVLTYNCTNRHFTTEIFKIEIGNLPKCYSINNLKKFLVKLNLQPKKIKMVPKRNFAFVTFKCEEDRQNALKTIENFEWKKKILTAKVAKAKDDPYEQKKSQGMDEIMQPLDTEKDPQISNVNPLERIRDVVTPLWNMSYEEEQSLKCELMAEVLKKLGKELRSVDAAKWVRKNRCEHSGMCCPLEKLCPSPIYESYRNKCEFTIGPGVNAIDKKIGFRLAAYKDGNFAVVEPWLCSHIPQTMKDAVNLFQRYISESPLNVFDPGTNEGFWRQLTVRVNRNDNIMCIVQFSPQQDMCESTVESEIEKLRNYLKEQNKLELTCVYVEITCARKVDDESKNVLRHILGDKAFFQVNTRCAEILYDLIREWSEITSNTVILDVCCGTGTIGLTIAKNAKRVIGIELCEEAIADAKFNAELNGMRFDNRSLTEYNIPRMAVSPFSLGISNVEYQCGKAEDVLVKTTSTLEAQESQVVAILDPPRPGCHAKVLQAVRRCSRINKLIYVSCSPNSVRKDFIALCRPTSKRVKGDPFQIVKAQPIDLFPQTRCCELVVLLERQITS
ncbi:tRNA (uracil-5-)-methyltransferase homolog A-like isoform X2 [Xenia sp. Carnegie-2017]|uniref:tRNA (uracil-5-)-methyltransferase homolog A-like isoform X2 n=1 Tax=Xenia sp. Carnegie-2017 TaxID=2897299 RepID=UPI001F03FA5F|nr:tRNA (uracil-5-)-methyltransferase homolog A-like isoform X2 [Xenia sp. Carnegie-2017]